MKRPGRPPRVMALASAAVLTLGCGALLSAPASAGIKWTLLSSGKATGQYALANTNGEVVKPVKIELKVTGASLVQWSMDCFKGSKLIMTKGKSTLKAAGTVQLKITKSANNCQLAANAQNYGAGKITLSIESAS
ncbi:MAG: hypothetical protein WBD82_03335 [Acidimicrobiales bacterium]